MSWIEEKEHFKHKEAMTVALQEAYQAEKEGETPVGAALFCGGDLLAHAHNLCAQKADPTMHAELLAVQAACSLRENPYLRDCILYVTLEPCCQCAAALAHCQLGALVFGAYDVQYGACGSAFSLVNGALAWHIPTWGGYMRKESEMLLKNHFQSLRSKK